MTMQTSLEKCDRILLIEDDPDNAGLVKRKLDANKEYNFLLESVQTLEAARCLLSEKKFDILILDLKLQAWQGIKSFKSLDILNKDLPIIVLAKNEEESVGLQFLKAGAQECILQSELTHQDLGYTIRKSIVRYQSEERLRESNRELRRLKNNLENQVADTVRIMMEKDSMLISRSQQVLTGEMVSNIANQWKQPLNSLSMVIQAINDSYKYGDLTAEMLDKKTSLSIELINYLARTIDDFREYFEPRKQRQMFDISLLLEKTIGFIEYSLETDGIRLQLETERDCYAEGYPNEFSQAIINIVNNAREVIKYRAIPAEKRVIIIKTVCQNKISRITIEDKAGGIPESNLTKIFEPHFTTKAEKGTGVGLYMSKSIIEQKMNGRLGVENTNEGAKFIIEL